MSILIREAELFWAKLGAPVNPFNAEFPHWELQIRTRDKGEKKKWEDYGLNVVPVEDDDGIFYRVNLKRKAKTKNRATGEVEDRTPVSVVDGNLMPLDATIVGNGSVGNVQIDDYTYMQNGAEKQGFSLRAIQVLKLVEYKGAQSPFEIEGDTEVVVPTDTNEEDTDW